MPLLIFLSPPHFKDMAQPWWAPSGTHYWQGLGSVIIAKQRERGFSLSLASRCLSSRSRSPPPFSHRAPYLSFLHTNKLTSGWIHIYKDVQQFDSVASLLNGLRQMWRIDVCTANTPLSTVPVSVFLGGFGNCSAVSRAREKLRIWNK